jgi:predicted O-methyltransferase YrrM
MNIILFIKYAIVFNKRQLLARLRGQPKAIAAALGCDGQTEVDELAVLSDYARKVDPAYAIVEVGSFRGRSCVAMALSCSDGVQVYSVDPYLETHDWKDRVRAYSFRDQIICLFNLAFSGAIRNTRNIHLPSGEASRAWGNSQRLQSIGMVFIDGSHIYEDVRNDFEAWLPHVAIGGILCFHDSTNVEWGVYPLMEQLKQRTDIEFLALVNSLSLFRKIA